MKINDSTYSNQSLQAAQRIAQQGKVQKIQAPSERANTRVENNPQDSAQKGQQQRFDADSSAIALVESQLQSQSLSLPTQTGQGNQNNGAQQQGFSQYDEPSKQNQSAVAAYETVDNIAQRENVKQFFGVNLFA